MSPRSLPPASPQAEEQLFSPLRSKLGFDELVAINVGAAPTPVEVLEFFHAIGVPIGELWGMSETCGVVTCNPPDKVKIGTVGPAGTRRRGAGSPRTARSRSRRTR